MYTLGIYGITASNYLESDEVHDHSLVLMNQGKILDFVQLERITGQKYDNRLDLYIEEILDRLRIDSSLRIVFVDSYAGDSFISKGGKIRLEAINNSCFLHQPVKAKGYYQGSNVETWLCNHELAHIGSSLPFAGAFKNNSLLIHIDAGASKSNCSVWHYIDGRLQYIHHSWELHTVTKNFCCNPLIQNILMDYSETSIAGKLMGYAGYGKDNPLLRKWLISHNWFLDKPVNTFLPLVEKELGIKKANFDYYDPFFMNIAACMQQELEEQVTSFIYKYGNMTKADYLYYSGGTALNIIINSQLEKSGKFKAVYIPPCCNDTGLALGAAALVEFLINGRVEKHSPFLNSFGLTPYTYSPSFDLDAVAKKIAAGGIIAVCTGNGEIGPRALGHRSLLASPASLEIRDKLSLTMKKRDWYRPVAPVILKSRCNEVFKGTQSSNLAQWMLGNYTVTKAWKAAIPGVIHADDTARVQIVAEEDKNNQLIVNLLSRLSTNYNIPCLINTSFNSSGRPIVHTREDAVAEAARMGIKFLIYNNDLIEL